MGRIPEETIQRVIEASEIVDVIMGYVPDLKQVGSTFKACCPFHSERTPSFNVNAQRQYYKCFGCGEGGNVLSFVMKLENLTFPDAVKKLAQRSNITIEEEEVDPQVLQKRRSKMRLIELNNAFANHLHRLLIEDPGAQSARDYLKSRGYGSEMAERWRVGWIPERPQSLTQWAKAKKFTPRELIDAGIAALRSPERPQDGIYYRFRDRLMFPIRNDYGDVIGFSGRQLKADPNSGKYINSPETIIFKKSKVFFGLDKARAQIPKQGYALLCEGQLDVIACHEHGFTTAIATQGTACTPEHIQVLKRYTKHVSLCYDSDSAGSKATQKAFVECARAGLYVKVVSLPAGEDPDSILNAHGPARFQELLEGARDFFDYKIRYEALQRDLQQPAQKAELASELALLFSEMSDNLQLQSSLSFVATRLGMSEEALRLASRQRARRSYPPRRARAETQAEEENALRVVPLVLPEVLRTICHLILTSQEVYEWCQEQFEALYEVADEEVGGLLLQTLLKAQPAPQETSRLVAYLETFPPQQRALLSALYQEDLVAEPLAAAKKSFHLLSRRAIERKLATKRAELGRDTLRSEEQVRIQKDILDLQKFLSEIRSLT